MLTVEPNSWPTVLYDLDLAYLLQILSILATAHPDLGDQLANYLGEGWEAHAGEIVKLRDLYAHGRLLDAVLRASFNREWWGVMRTVGLAARLQIGIDSYLQSLAEDERE